MYLLKLSVFPVSWVRILAQQLRTLAQIEIGLFSARPVDCCSLLPVHPAWQHYSNGGPQHNAGLQQFPIKYPLTLLILLFEKIISVHMEVITIYSIYEAVLSYAFVSDFI
jgi:hypothetical protein